MSHENETPEQREARLTAFERDLLPIRKLTPTLQLNLSPADHRASENGQLDTGHRWPDGPGVGADGKRECGACSVRLGPNDAQTEPGLCSGCIARDTMRDAEAFSKLMRTEPREDL